MWKAEAELLAAITLFFERVGLTANDVGIKVRFSSASRLHVRHVPLCVLQRCYNSVPMWPLR